MCRRSIWSGRALVIGLLLQACSAGDPRAPDADGRADGRADAAQALEGGAALDAALADAFAGLPGVGALVGQCGVVDDTSWLPEPPLYRNTLDFGAPYTFDAQALSAGGRQIFEEGNLGGSSLHSEIFAFEVLRRCELATLVKTEGKIDYQNAGGKKADLLLTIDGAPVGVSVTRAYHFPPEDPYTVQEASALLVNKLADLHDAAANATAADGWKRSLLSVIAYDASYADAIEQAHRELGSAERQGAVVIVTVTDGEDAFVY